MAETYQFRDGLAYLWTGAANASGAAVAWVNNATITMNRAYQSDPMADGTYRYHYTGQELSYSLAAGWNDSTRLQTLWDAATGTPVHAKFLHNNALDGSAGYIFYSGRLTNLTLTDAHGAVTIASVQGEGRLWSAF